MTIAQMSSFAIVCVSVLLIYHPFPRARECSGGIAEDVESGVVKRPKICLLKPASERDLLVGIVVTYSTVFFRTINMMSQ
jgi:hypothetical protein